MEENNQESQPPAAAAPLPLPPPGPLPPPATDAGYLELLGVLRLRVRGLAPWMLPRYFLFNVDVYDFHPKDLLATYPSATAADGSSALYFINVVRPKTATDSRKKRAVPGGTWKSERCPVPLLSEAIKGTRQTFSFTVLGAQGEEIRPGFIMQELALAGEEGKLDGGEDMAISKIYPSPRGDKAKRKAKPVRTSRKKRKMAAYSAPVQQAAPVPAASFSPAPPLRLGSSSPAHQVPSPAPPLRLGASTSSAHPLGQGTASTSSAHPLGQGAASTSSAPPLGQGAARRFLVLELADFPPLGEDFLPQKIYRASEVVGARRVAVECEDVVLLQKKRLSTPTDISRPEASKFISSPGLDTHQLSFTYEELNAATLGFSRDHFLGQGWFGNVYKGVLHGSEIAIKVLNPHGFQGIREFCTEVMVLSRMHHPNLVKLVGFCAYDDQRILISEFLPMGSLETHIFDLSPEKKPLDWNTRMKILAGAAQGLKHLHVNCNPPVIHCDVKCANILLDEGYHPKLSDFGLTKLGPTGDNTYVSTRVMGTPGYCAPEYLEGCQLTIKSDVYSFGIVILEVITGRKAFGQSPTRAEHSLAEWATSLINRRDFARLADPALGNQYSMTSLRQVLTIAGMCLNATASQRPEMINVAVALTYISESEENAVSSSS